MDFFKIFSKCCLVLNLTLLLLFLFDTFIITPTKKEEIFNYSFAKEVKSRRNSSNNYISNYVIVAQSGDKYYFPKNEIITIQENEVFVVNQSKILKQNLKITYNNKDYQIGVVYNDLLIVILLIIIFFITIFGLQQKYKIKYMEDIIIAVSIIFYICFYFYLIKQCWTGQCLDGFKHKYSL